MILRFYDDHTISWMIPWNMPLYAIIIVVSSGINGILIMDHVDGDIHGFKNAVIIG